MPIGSLINQVYVTLTTRHQPPINSLIRPKIFISTDRASACDFNCTNDASYACITKSIDPGTMFWRIKLIIQLFFTFSINLEFVLKVYINGVRSPSVHWFRTFSNCWVVDFFLIKMSSICQSCISNREISFTIDQSYIFYLIMFCLLLTLCWIALHLARCYIHQAPTPDRHVTTRSGHRCPKCLCQINQIKSNFKFIVQQLSDVLLQVKNLLNAWNKI